MKSGDAVRAIVSQKIRHALVVLGVLTAMIVTGPTAARAATTLCISPNYGYDCVASTGYRGQPTWRYEVDSRGHSSTNYAAYRLSQNGSPDPGSFGDARNWAKNARAAGYRVDSIPAVGSIAQWDATPQSADGHVAVVEVVAPTFVEVTDDSYGGTTARKRYMRGQSDWPHSFIHIKDAVLPKTPGAQLMGDVDGDRKADKVTYFAASGQWYVVASSGASGLWITGLSGGSRAQFLADVNGDGRDDAVVYFASTGEWYVAESAGSYFKSYYRWHVGHGVGSTTQLIADVDGDRKADAVVFFGVNGTWHVAASSAPSGQWTLRHGAGFSKQYLADVSGDGRADAIVYFPDSGQWYLAFSTGTKFTSYYQWRNGHNAG